MIELVGLVHYWDQEMVEMILMAKNWDMHLVLMGCYWDQNLAGKILFVHKLVMYCVVGAVTDLMEYLVKKLIMYVVTQ